MRAYAIYTYTHAGRIEARHEKTMLKQDYGHCDATKHNDNEPTWTEGDKDYIYIFLI